MHFQQFNRWDFRKGKPPGVFVAEIDLPNDDLGPLAPPQRRSESEARARLAELGLNNAEVEARIQWARKWMATITVPAGQQPSFLPL